MHIGRHRKQADRRRRRSDNETLGWASLPRIQPVAAEISPDGMRAWRPARVRALELAEAEKVEAMEAARLTKALVDARRQISEVLPPELTQRLAAYGLSAALSDRSNA